MAAGLAACSLTLPAAVLARGLGWSLGAARMTPLLYPILVYRFSTRPSSRSARVAYRWRNTFYPLEVLRNRLCGEAIDVFAADSSASSAFLGDLILQKARADYRSARHRRVKPIDR